MTAIALVVGLSQGVSSAAETKGGAPKEGGVAEKKEKGTASPAKKDRVIDFTKEEEVRGVLIKPEGELIGARRRVIGKSLIPIRLNFVPEMMKTVQEL